MPLGVHAKIGIGWAFLICSGFYGFYLAKLNVDKQRYENMKARQRMRLSNEGEYEPSSRKFSA